VFIPERWIRDEKAGPRPDPVIPTKVLDPVLERHETVLGYEVGNFEPSQMRIS
jgi:hypothetical protein